MSTQTAQIFEDAMRLPEADRADLAACLFATLDPSTVDQLDPSWEEEIKRRLQAIATGEAKLIPWEEARKRIFDDA